MPPKTAGGYPTVAGKDKDRADWSEPKTAGDIAAAAVALNEAQAQLIERVSRLDKTAWERDAEFAMDGHVAWKAPLGEMMWGLLFDAVHHRGQLSQRTFNEDVWPSVFAQFLQPSEKRAAVQSVPLRER